MISVPSSLLSLLFEPHRELGLRGSWSQEYFDYAESVQARKYAFKCHRKVEDGRDVVYPVNTIAFHPILGTFATGGSLSALRKAL